MYHRLNQLLPLLLIIALGVLAILSVAWHF